MERTSKGFEEEKGFQSPWRLFLAFNVTTNLTFLRFNDFVVPKGRNDFHTKTGERKVTCISSKKTVSPRRCGVVFDLNMLLQPI